VTQDLVDGGRLLDDGEDAHPAIAASTFENVSRENPADQQAHSKR